MTENRHIDLDVQPKDLPQWVVWRAEDHGGPKPTKVPYTPALGPNPPKASSVDRSTWGTNAEARAVYKRGGFDGIGFVFTDSDPFVGIDLDNCVDPITGEINEWALAIVEELDTYTELSPSGTGLHIICRGKLPPGRRGWGDGHVMGETGRYFTMTGKPVTSRRTFEHRQDELVSLHRRIFPPEPRSPEAVRPNPAALPGLTDEELIRRAEGAKNGDKFRGLYHYGDVSGYESRSQADYALINEIAFWTGPDPERIFRLFMDSALGERDKVRDRPKYVTDSIKKALGSIKAFYDPKSPLNGDRVTGVTGDRGVTQTQSDDELTPMKSENKVLSPMGMRFVPSVPFPIRVFPEPARKLIEEAVSAMDCPADLIGMPVLAGLASAIGSTRRIALKPDWKESASLFLCVVASPGSMKSPASSVALNPLYELQGDQVREYEEAWEVYEERLREYEVEKKAAAKAGEAAPPPPKEPAPKQSVASDTTVEALVQILQANNRGVLIDYDELSGWIRGMDQYKGGKGADRQYWLSIYSSKPITVNRSSRKGVTFVKNPVVSIFGGIQPALLGELGGVNQDGLMDRFLFSYPHHRAIRVKDEVIEVSTLKTYSWLLDSITNLTHAPDGSPIDIPLSSAAWRAFKSRANSLASDTEEPGFPMKLEAIWAKLRGYLGRIALVLAVTRSAAVRTELEYVDEEDIENAWRLIEYFKAHAQRVHGVIEEADPLDVLAGVIKSVIEDAPDETWVGSATELVEALTQYGAEDIPGPSGIRKTLSDIRERTPALRVEEGKRTKASRSLRLSLIKDKHPLSPVTPVILSPFNGEKSPPTPEEEVTEEDIDAAPDPGIEEPEPPIHTLMTFGSAEHPELPCKPHETTWKECFICNPDHPKRALLLGEE